VNEYLVFKLLVVAAAGLVGLVGAINTSRKRAAVRAKMLAAPSTFEDNAAVTFTGTVKPLGELLVAPLSGKPCVAYRALARIYGVRGGLRLERELAETKMVPFMLATKHGDVLVDGDQFQLLARGEPIIPGNVERERRFLALEDMRGTGFDELRIEPDAKITVHGIARQELAEHGGETGFREAPTQIRLTGDDAHPLTIDHA
jgi:hypothetical protein